MNIKRHLNQGRLYVLLHSVRPAVESSDIYFYVKKGNSGFRLPYTMRKIGIDRELCQLLQPIVNQFASKYPVEQQENYYLFNILTGSVHVLILYGMVPFG